jgi:hypothetical protein
VHGTGTYLPESREIFWLVGELGPKGDPDAEGILTYTVALTDGLPSGTVVSNQAVVYFPGLTYTPVANFTGEDGFTFRVSNGVTTSHPAQVYTTVTPEGDTPPPQVLWTGPQADATVIVSPTTPVFTDTLGPAYVPAILIGVSEPLSETTAITATVILARGGASIPTSVDVDGSVNQILLLPRATMSLGVYTVSVSNGVSDRAGNPLAEAYHWRFTVAATSAPPYHDIYLPLVLRED